MAEALIMSARIAAGWFTEEELAAELIEDAVEEDEQPQIESVPLWYIDPIDAGICHKC